MNYIKLGQTISRAKVSRCGDNDYPVLSITMKDGIVMQSDKFKKRIASKDISEYKVIPAGMLVQGIHMDEGNFGIQDIVPYGIVSPAYTVWTVDESVVFPKYIEMVLRSPRCIDYYRSKLNGTVNRRGHMSEGDFLGMQIPCPSIEEQKHVVTTMNQVKQVMISLIEEMTALDQLIKARFVEMFGDPMTNDKGYGLKKYGDVFELNAGGTPSKTHPEYWDGGTISWIGSNMCQDRYIYQNDGKYITQAGFDNSSARLFPIDTVLVALVGATIGKTALLKFETTTNQNVLGICGIRESGYIPEFVYYYTQGLYKKFIGISDGGFSMASKGFIAELPIPIVPMALQEEFARFADKVDKSKLTIQASLDQLETLKQSLMQKYFGY